MLIGTPIGNLSDLSPRAEKALRDCDLLLCEDTRHTGRLLSHFNISTRLDSFHDHNEREKTAGVLQMIEDGRTIGLVSDAGMPLLSDPGFPLVREARERGIAVEPVPGPFAAALALVASGLPPLPFAFFGFTPKKAAERQAFYRDVLARGMTAVVYESPYRIRESLGDALAVFGDIPMTLAREMTKMHEEYRHGRISELQEEFANDAEGRGEMTLVFAITEAAQNEEISADDLSAQFNELRNAGMRRPDAVKVLAERHGLNKRDLYRKLGE